MKLFVGIEHSVAVFLALPLLLFSQSTAEELGQSGITSLWHQCTDHFLAS